MEEARRVRDPSARREHLQRSGAHFSFRRHLESVGEEDRKTLQFLLDGTGDMSPVERAAFSFFDHRAPGGSPIGSRSLGRLSRRRSRSASSSPTYRPSIWTVNAGG